MPSRVVRQPNGLFAIFSTIVDAFTYYHCTGAEIVQIMIDEYDCGRRTAEEKLARGVGDAPDDKRFANRWDEALDDMALPGHDRRGAARRLRHGSGSRAPTGSAMTRRTFLSASLAALASPVIGMPHRLSVAPGIGAQAGLAALPPGYIAGIGIALAYAQALREASEALERLGAQGPTQAEMVARMERHPA